jgi:hypothetical protein
MADGRRSRPRVKHRETIAIDLTRDPMVNPSPITRGVNW